MENKPLVSICCITFNHEPYIRQAIDGFLMQKTNFPIEIIIHDDASTDNTAKIIKEYADNYPDVIFPIYQTKNQYSQGVKPLQNIVWPRARGKYIALCEGDDYWTDSNKLQKQVDFLENNLEYGMVFTDYDRWRQKDSIRFNNYNRVLYKENTDRDITTYNLFSKEIKITRTATVLFKKDIITSFDKTIPLAFPTNSTAGDTQLFVFAIINYKVRYFAESTTVYRVLNESIGHTSNPVKRNKFLKSYIDFVEFAVSFYNLGKKEKKYLKKIKGLFDLQTAYLENKKKEFFKIFFYLIRNGILTMVMIQQLFGLFSSRLYQYFDNLKLSIINRPFKNKAKV